LPAPVSQQGSSTPSGRNDASLDAALDPSLGCSARRSATRRDRVFTQDVVDPDNHEPRYMDRHGVDLHQRRGLHQFRRIAVEAVLTPSSPLSIVPPQRIEDRRIDLHHSGVTSSVRNPAPSSSPKGCWVPKLSTRRKAGRVEYGLWKVEGVGKGYTWGTSTSATAYSVKFACTCLRAKRRECSPPKRCAAGGSRAGWDSTGATAHPTQTSDRTLSVPGGRAKAMPRKRRHAFTTTAADGVWLFVSGKRPMERDAWSH
jgi:hypothetical protein